MKKLLTNKNSHCCFFTDDGEFTGVVIGGKKNSELEIAKEYLKKNFEKIKKDIGKIGDSDVTLCDFKEPTIECIEYNGYEDDYRIASAISSKTIQECWYFRILEDL